jgi:hypothetical protein
VSISISIGLQMNHLEASRKNILYTIERKKVSPTILNDVNVLLELPLLNIEV